MIINKDNWIEFVLGKHPDFSEAWRRHLAYWEGDSPGLCIDIAAFEHFFVEKLKEEDEASVAEILATVEILLTDGTQDIIDAAGTCFLESLLNESSWGRFDLKLVVGKLGPRSREICSAWDKFTGVQTDGLKEVEGQT